MDGSFSPLGPRISKPTELRTGITYSHKWVTVSDGKWFYSSFSHFILNLYILSVEIQQHILCIDLGCILHAGEGAPFSQCVISQLASQLYFQKAIPLLCQANNFWVM